MEQEEKDAINYRFSGYQLPMIQLDETGPAYYCVAPHPYLFHQPQYWAHDYFVGHPGGFSNASNANKLYPFLGQNGGVDENT